MWHYKYLNIMKANYLFPAVFRKIGWRLLIPFGLLSIYCLYVFNYGSDGFQLFQFPPFNHSPEQRGFIDVLLDVGENGALDEIASIGLAVSLLFVGFSREKDEDECIARIRMNSLVWAILVNYLLLILATVFIYGAAYLSVAFVGLFTVLIFFIVKYRWDLYQFKKNGVEDE